MMNYPKNTKSFNTYTNTYFTPIDIGAFYESTTQTEDNSVSIADKTFVLLDSSNNGVSVEQLELLDTNADGKLDETEISTLKTWKDINEDGIAQEVCLVKLISNNRFYQANYKKVA